MHFILLEKIEFIEKVGGERWERNEGMRGCGEIAEESMAAFVYVPLSGCLFR